MSNRFNINNNTRLQDDRCAIEMLNADNQIINDRRFQPYLSNIDPSRNKYFDSFNQPGVFQTGNYAGLPSHIDDSSSMRLGKYGEIMTHDRTKRQNPETSRVNPANKSVQTMALNPDVMSRLYISEMTKDRASIRGREIDRFVPLIPELENEVQNPKHLIPTYWVRGGMDTKSVIRNIDYMKTCGLQK
jgi:hypothetical protein